MKIGFAGDWHGDGPWARGRVMSLGVRGISTVMQLGDFGIWDGFEGRRYIRDVEKTCKRYGVRLLVTPGNHENFALINSVPVEQRDELGPIQWLTDHIALLPRGHRFELGGRSFVSLGGAPSVDREWRVEGESWWREEAITEADVEKVVAGGHAEIMLTHDSPGVPYCTPAVERILTGNGGTPSWSPEALAYAAIGRERLERAYVAVRPSVLAHGHYHVRDEGVRPTPGGGSALVVSLACNNMKGATAILDLDDLTIA